MSTTLLYKEALTVRNGYTRIPVKAVPYNTDHLLITWNITAIAGTTPSVAIGITAIDDNGNEPYLAGTQNITAQGVGAFHIGPGVSGTVLPTGLAYLLNFYMGGTTPSFTMQVALYAVSTYK